MAPIAFAQATPQYWVMSSRQVKDYEFSTQDNVTIFDSVTLFNRDPARWLNLDLKGTVEGKKGWFSFTKDSVFLAPNERMKVPFTIVIPNGVCDGKYRGKVEAFLTEYQGAPDVGGGTSVNLAIAENVFFHINTDKYCSDPLPGLGKKSKEVYANFLDVKGVVSNAYERFVFWDYNADSIYDPVYGDRPFVEGIVEMYDFDNKLIHVTDLSQTRGRYSLPAELLTEKKDLFFRVFAEDQRLLNTFVVRGVEDYADIDANFQMPIKRKYMFGQANSLVSDNYYSSAIGGTPMMEANVEVLGPFDYLYRAISWYWSLF